MSKNNVVKLTGRDTIIDPLTELLRTGAEQLIYQAVETELLELLAEHSERRTADGKAGVVRSGHLPARKLQTGIGPVTVKIPKVPNFYYRSTSVPLGRATLVLQNF